MMDMGAARATNVGAGHIAMTFGSLAEGRETLGTWSRELLNVQAQVIEAVGNLKTVMQVVVGGALRAIPNATGAVVEIREGSDLVYRAVSGSCAGHVGVRLPQPASLSWVCVLTGKPQVCPDTEKDHRVDRETCRLIGARSLLIAPLSLQGVNVGVLKIVADIPTAFDNRDLLTTQLLAGQIAIGLANAAQADAAKRFSATFEQAAVGIAHVAPDGRFLLVNDRFCAIAGRERENLIDGGFQQITHPDDLEADVDNAAALTRGDIDQYSMEKRYIRKDGTLVWVNLTVSLVRRSDGSPDFFVSVVEDISSRRAAEQAASHDALTGLPNRRWLLDRLDMELQRKASRPLCVAYLDLDGFKGVNDRFGHAEGDKCLIAVARALKAALRKDDIVGRIAGDEFVVILPETSRGIALSLLGRLRQTVNEISRATRWGVSVSVGGILLKPGVEASVEGILIAADRVMYDVKRARREIGLFDLDAPDRPEQAA
jgi:diguanylate cyclase (GGDEF)-like protein/PAS domain S-box-containing protein